MTNQHWLRPVETALAATDAPLAVFCRDDDVGWTDAALWPLIDVVGRCGAHLDMAVIPTALTATSATTLGRAVDAADGRLHLHQHGYSHANHQTRGRKCEFGDERDARSKAKDIASGRARLESLLGERFEPVFTPPWNRCDQDTVAALEEQGFEVLSRDAGARPVQLHRLREVPIHFDWCKYSDGSDAGWHAIAGQIAERIEAGGNLGLMFHHAVMDATDRGRVYELLQRLAASGRVRWEHILSLADAG